MAASSKMRSAISLLVLFMLVIVCNVCGKPKSVTVTLDAKWNSTPLLLEASEYIAKENKESFWRFVEEVSRLDPKVIASDTDQAYYNMILKYTAKLLSALHVKLLEFSLSLRVHSPAIEMYRKLAKSEKVAEDCTTFVNIHGQITCDVKEVQSLIDGAADKAKPPIFKFDHVYPNSEDNSILVVLYGELGEEGFREFHQLLLSLTHQKKITYVLRWHTKSPADTKTRLSGYGVELAIKSTEYKAKDDTKVESGQTADADEDEGEDEVQGFIFSKLRELHPESVEDLKAFKKHLTASSTELAALKVWQLQDLSLQAAQKIVSTPTENVLSVLTDLSQNFPSRTRSLIKVPVNEEFKKEMKKNQQYFESSHSLGAGDSAMYLNGLTVDMEVYDVYTLLDLMRQEANLMEGLFSLGFKGSEVNQMLKLDLSGDSSSFALDTRHTAVHYINDLENDRKYKNWPNSVQDILRPTFPGMLRHVAKNFFHLVFIVDPLDVTSRELIKLAEAFYVHSAPLRIAVVLAADADREVTGYDDGGVALARAFDYLRQKESSGKALSFVTDVFEQAQSKEITAEMVIKEFKHSYKDADEGLVFGDEEEYDTLRKAANDYITKSGLKELPQVLLNGVPMDRKYLDENNFEEGVVSEVLAQTPSIQKDVYQGHLHDFVNINEYLMEKENVLPRLNFRILTPSTKTLDFTSNVDADIYHDKNMFAMMSSKDITSILAQNMKYLSRKDDGMQAVTMWIVCDLESSQGRELLYSAMKHLKHSHDMRLGIVFNTDTEGSSTDFRISRAVYTALHTLNNNMAKNFITKLVKEENVEALKTERKQLSDLEVHGMDTMNYLLQYEGQNTDFLKVHRVFVEKTLGWKAADRGIISNGQILGPLDVPEVFIQEDVDLLERFMFQQGGKKMKSQLSQMGHSDSKGSDLMMKVAALLSQSSTSKERKEVHFGSDQHSVVKIPADNNSPAYQIDVIVDPASRDAQKTAPILMVLKEVTNVNIRIFMNCKDKLSEMPVKTYFRYVMEPNINFKADGTFADGPVAKFVGMPQKSLLTLGMNPPESWLVEAVTSPHDLDNILLEETKTGVYAVFDLEYILLEGHCSDSTTGQPPRGLQFTLGTNSSDDTVDTIVMANLGYFQLKANPGAWNLNLREGRSNELYDITSHEFTDTPSGSQDVVIAINSFKSKIIRVKVAKKEDMAGEQLLKDSDEDQSLWDSISSTITGDKKEEDKDKTLNIFSLASGHMYERLMRIMMMSVLKHTKSKVKFWFLKNYLSPSFKDFIPKMAKEYDFEFELVQYKWPRWLNQQKEKQRIMWGYKILFLDVLFPLDVKKIIFVDADQIVRTDLQNLHDLDLGGAPYGYTPFCDSRKEMDGFRFWKSGYWASHLANRKYHISALYVVDLKKFRQIAAGDRLRGQYQGLSQDPNSLSNLDQDLPNNMIHQVSIKSLPQEWLWCETWCSDDTKPSAKTIDLCNNPQTKEPKLKAALRIVPEWKEYDYEIKVLWDKVYGTDTRQQIEYDPPNIDSEKIGLKWKKDEL